MKFSKIAFSSLAVAAGSFLLALPAGAVDLDVSATVTEDCTIVTAPVAFGNYAPTTTNLTAELPATGSVTVSCTAGSTAHVLLGQGLHAGGGSSDAVPARQMNDGGLNNLAYFLYTDLGETDPWGNTNATGVDQLGSGSASPPITVFGSVPGAQNVPAGAYTDTVAATFTF